LRACWLLRCRRHGRCSHFDVTGSFALVRAWAMVVGFK
jgi:hypothetical protein